jgi:hypothetical protein
VHTLALSIRAHFGPVCDSVCLSRLPTSPPSRTLDGAAAERKASESHGHAVGQPVGAEPRVEPRGLEPESQSIRARLASVWLPRVTGRTPPAGRRSNVWFGRYSTHLAQTLHLRHKKICKPVTTALSSGFVPRYEASRLPQDQTPRSHQQGKALVSQIAFYQGTLAPVPTSNLISDTCACRRPRCLVPSLNLHKPERACHVVILFFRVGQTVRSA